jgi:type I restriction enzyme S subunit
MSKSWPLVALGEVLRKSEESVPIDPNATYREVTIKLWGKGVMLRREAAGSEIAAPRRSVVRAGQFILSRIDARNGAFGVVPPALDGAVVSNDFPSYNLNPQRIFPEYLGWLSRSAVFVDLCKAASEGTTNRVRLKEEKFLATAIALPPLAEQQRIVARIEQLAAKIEEAQGLRQLAVEEAEALVTSARANLFSILLSGKSERLEDVATLERGKFSHRPRNDARFFGGYHPWIQIAEIESAGKYITKWDQTLNDDGLAISRKFPKGTLLISIAATIGAVGILDFDCCIPDSIVAITPKVGVDSEYLYHYLCYVRSDLERIAPQSAQKNINLKTLAPLPIAILPFPEQRNVIAYLDDLQTKVDYLKRFQAETVAELDALLPSLLDKAFRGELV